MNSRMERYQSSEDELAPSRTEKNSVLYDSLADSDLSRVKTNTNVSIIDNVTKEINIEKIKRYIKNMNQEKPNQRKKIEIIPEEESEEELPRSEELQKIYDINSVLEKAKLGREIDYEEERYKKLKDTQFDILNKLEIEEIPPEKPVKEEFNTNERTIIDLINTITLHKDDLFSELKSDNENTEILKPINEEALNEDLREEITALATESDEATAILEDLEKLTAKTGPIEIDKIIEKEPEEKEPKIDKMESKISTETSFFTNSMTFGKRDFEGYDELEKSTKKKNVITKFGILLLVCLALVTIYIILTYVLDIKLF